MKILTGMILGFFSWYVFFVFWKDKYFHLPRYKTFRQKERDRLHLEAIMSRILLGKVAINEIIWGDDYCGYTKMLQELLEVSKRTGLKLSPVLRKLRLSLASRSRLENTLFNEQNSLGFQYLLSVVLVWVMIFYIHSLQLLSMDHGLLFSVALGQIGVFLGGRFLFLQRKRQWVEDPMQVLVFHFKLQALIWAGQSIGEYLGQKQRDPNKKAHHFSGEGVKVLNGLGKEGEEHYLAFLHRVQRGEVTQDDWDNLEADVYFFLEQRMEKLKKFNQSLRIFIMSIGGLGGMLLVLYYMAQSSF